MNSLRPVCRVKAMSPRIAESEESTFRRWFDRFAVARSRASRVLADVMSNCHDRLGPDEGKFGASSRTTCAFVPPVPNELTPARRGTPGLDCQGCRWEFT